MERFREPPGLRRVLEAAGSGPDTGPGNGADTERGWLVGPGRLLRTAEDLRGTGKARQEESELPGGGPLESWRMVARRWAQTGPRRFRQRYRGVLQEEHSDRIS